MDRGVTRTYTTTTEDIRATILPLTSLSPPPQSEWKASINRHNKILLLRLTCTSTMDRAVIAILLTTQEALPLQSIERITSKMDFEPTIKFHFSTRPSWEIHRRKQAGCHIAHLRWIYHQEAWRRVRVEWLLKVLFNPRRARCIWTRIQTSP